MAAPAFAPERVQTAPRRVRMVYERGSCPKCLKPMLVSKSMPHAPCVDCYVK